MKQKDMAHLNRKLRETGTKFLDLKYASLTGAMHHITVPFDRLEGVVDEGVGADCSSLPGYKVDRREKLPTDVYEAINALQKDNKFLLRGHVFTGDLIEGWAEVQTKESEEIHLRPHHYGLTLYVGV